ncbi:hypothetical protein CEXT_114721 [Caerostris extrusa]|uniref:Uncharacterized protein n=1 Tax=Caerostris extrusa TaxID=172846 RepID=A0AAV4X3M2_CAEEX|nr:hypothetical protein CEXT_114721 [Caerostris extrusa]
MSNFVINDKTQCSNSKFMLPQCDFLNAAVNAIQYCFSCQYYTGCPDDFLHGDQIYSAAITAAAGVFFASMKRTCFVFQTESTVSGRIQKDIRLLSSLHVSQQDHFYL